MWFLRLRLSFQYPLVPIVCHVKNPTEKARIMSTNIKITASPHVRSPDSTIKIMWSVVISLVPVIAASIYFFGPSALLVILTCVAACLLTERLFGSTPGSVADGSAMITGLLLGLTLPPGFPLWMAFLGGGFYGDRYLGHCPPPLQKYGKAVLSAWVCCL